MTDHTFTALLWIWDARREDTWMFVTLPTDVSADVDDEASALGPRKGFGSVRVEARIGASIWRTSVFPDSRSECFVLPIKKAIRAAEGVEAGDTVAVSVRVV